MGFSVHHFFKPNPETRDHFCSKKCIKPHKLIHIEMVSSFLFTSQYTTLSIKATAKPQAPSQLFGTAAKALINTQSCFTLKSIIFIHRSAAISLNQCIGLLFFRLIRIFLLRNFCQWSTMATYATYRHIELDKVGYSKKR